MDTVALFWSKVDKSAGPDGCWLWTAAKNRGGYPAFKRYVEGVRKNVTGHRFSWELENGSIPKGYGHNGTCVCHRCDVRHCVNPAHLFLGSTADNQADMKSKGRQARGETNSRAKLTEEAVKEIIGLRKSGIGSRRIARRFGIGKTTVKNVCSRATWAHVAVP